MEQLTINGAHLVTPVIHEDDRGAFFEWFRADRIGALGRSLNLAQANCSISRRGVLRGVHYADVPPGQAKYVMCVSGAIFDVVVDLRVGSPTFGRWQGVELDDRRRQALYVAEGLGHAFLALTDAATVVYLCSEAYNPGREHEINPMDPEIGIEWPAGVEPVLSPKDADAPMLAEARAAGRLPDYQKCLDLYESPAR